MRAAFLRIPLALLLFTNSTYAFNQTNETCSGYCAGWEIYWSGNYVWQAYQDQCAMDEKASAEAIITMASDVGEGGLLSGDIIAQAFACAWLVNTYINPILNTCSGICNSDLYAYAPNVDVTGRYSAPSMPGLWYDASGRTLNLEVYNSGTGLAENIKVDVYAGRTTNGSCAITNWERIGGYTIPQLAPANAQRNTLNIPYFRREQIRWEPRAGECNKVKIVADQENRIPELFETDNEYVLEINNLPSPPRYFITDVRSSFLPGFSDAVDLRFRVNNTGEAPGDLIVEVESATGVREQQVAALGPGQEREFHFVLHNLSQGRTTPCGIPAGLRITARERTSTGGFSYSLPLYVYTASVSGEVLDMFGNPVSDATVRLEELRTGGITGGPYGWYPVIGMNASGTNQFGWYELEGINKEGEFRIAASSPSHAQKGERRVNISFGNETAFCRDWLIMRDADIVLLDAPGILGISCPYGGYSYRLTSGNFTYQGPGHIWSMQIQGIAPGNYTLVLHKPGFSSSILRIPFSPGEWPTVDCGLRPMMAYMNDSGIRFSDEPKQLWTYELPEGLQPYYAEISKDGSTVFVHAVRTPYTGEGKLLIFSHDGRKLGEADVGMPTEGQGFPITSTYNGSLALVGNWMVIDRNGTVVSSSGARPRWSTRGVISQDGTYICSGVALFDRNFNPLTYRQLYGIPDDHQASCAPDGNVHFSLDGALVARCPAERTREGFWLCRQPQFGDRTVVGLIRGMVEDADDVADGSKILVSSGEEVRYYYFYGSWYSLEKEAHAARVSVSPGGGYLFVLEPHGFYYDLTVYDNNFNQLTHEERGGRKYRDLLAAEATGTGIYYLKFSDRKLLFGVIGEEGSATKQPIAGGAAPVQEEEKGFSIADAIISALGGLLNWLISFIQWLFGGGWLPK